MEVSSMLYKCTYCVFTLYGSSDLVTFILLKVFLEHFILPKVIFLSVCFVHSLPVCLYLVYSVNGLFSFHGTCTFDREVWKHFPNGNGWWNLAEMIILLAFWHPDFDFLVQLPIFCEYSTHAVTYIPYFVEE